MLNHPMLIQALRHVLLTSISNHIGQLPRPPSGNPVCSLQLATHSVTKIHALPLQTLAKNLAAACSDLHSHTCANTKTATAITQTTQDSKLSTFLPVLSSTAPACPSLLISLMRIYPQELLHVCITHHTAPVPLWVVHYPFALVWEAGGAWPQMPAGLQHHPC